VPQNSPCDQLSVDHIIPRAACPELDNVIANLELMPLRANESKNAKVGPRQLQKAEELHRAGLLKVLLCASEASQLNSWWLGAIERVLKLSESKLGQRAADKLELDWNQALPLAEIAASKLKPVVRFRGKRLALWRAKQEKL
jgi:hypothetical protein